MSRSTPKKLLKRLDQLLQRAERLLPAAPAETDWQACHAYRWSPAGGLQGIERPHRILLDDLLCIDRQKAEVVRNTGHFVAGRPANNILLWGARGTGKSSLIKAVFHHFEPQELRLIEVDKEHLLRLRDLAELLAGRRERFLLYCDDLSFEAEDPSYKSLKAVLEGTIAAPPDNVLVYATSNRRHLLPEFQADNQAVDWQAGELHPGEAIEEKVSLSDRFGIWLSFYPLSQEQYLQIVAHWLGRFAADAADTPECRAEALRWATQRGSRSGRVARQFAIEWRNRPD